MNHIPTPQEIKDFHDAAEQGAILSVQAFVQKFPDHIDAPDESVNGSTAIVYAVKGNNTNVLNYLLAAGANINHRGKNSQANALYIAANWGHLEAADVLLRAGIDYEAKDAWGDSAIKEAKEKGYTQIVERIEAEPERRIQEAALMREMRVVQEGLDKPMPVTRRLVLKARVS